ncbi:hypothetical protein ACFYXC_21020 [Streptomyces sp. NPDC002701]|uniref:hypothetical protein n=1 Tax=unclassified Streptomyces TaxID=2593676 RepID=UPI0036AF36AB
MSRARTALTALAAAAVAGVGLEPVVPAVATAAVAASEAVSASVLDAGAGAAATAADGVRRGTYVSAWACRQAGPRGIERDDWDQYQCVPESFWVLWTNR